jgi:hypothetical protein
MSEAHVDTSTAKSSARVPEGFRKPSHGRGLLKQPWAKGQSGFKDGKPSRYVETQQFAREHSLEAMQTLRDRLRDPDGRIAVVAANSLLERAWGKVREQKPEEREQMQIDLSQLSGPELALLMKLAASGRIKGIAVEAGSDAAPPVIEGNVEESKPGDRDR